MTDRIEFKHAPKKQLGLAAIGVILVAASYFMATHEDDPVYRVVGWTMQRIPTVKRAYDGK